MIELARLARGPGHIYFTGGATAMSIGLREQTLDLDLAMEPEPRGAFEAISELKITLDINVELASPADFIPVAADWRERSIPIAKEGQISFLHFDLCAQALAKIQRGYDRDLSDARGFLAFSKIGDGEVWAYFEGTRPKLIRYPALDAGEYERKVKAFLGRL